MPQDEPPPDQSFEGESNVTIDGKGRFAVPGRYRRILAEQCEGKVVLTLAFTPVTALPAEKKPFKKYPGLSILPLPVWRNFKANLESRERFDPVRAAFSVFVASALPCDIDGQGRILVPPALRDFLNRKNRRRHAQDGEEGHNRLKLIGVTERFELWREEVWESVRMAMLAAAAERYQAIQNAKQADPSSRSFDLPL